MSLQWFLARDQQRYGPYALDQLRAMAASGQLISSDLLWQEGAQQWRAASSVSEVFPPPEVPPPPVPQVGRRQDGHPTTPCERPLGIADQLQKLQHLHASGALSDEEFAKAKQAVLSGTPDEATRERKKRKRRDNLPPPNAAQGQYRAAHFQGLYMRFMLAYLGVVSVNLVIGFFPQLMTINLVTLLPRMIIVIVLSGIFLYRAWAQIQDGGARTTPGKAVGYRFIPLFAFYWEFVAVKGLAEDLEHYARARSIALAPIPKWLTVSYCILLIVAGLLSMVPILGSLLLIPLATVLLILFKKIADASAAIAEAKQHASPTAGTGPATDGTVQNAVGFVAAVTAGLSVMEKLIDKGHQGSGIRDQVIR